MDGFIDKKKDSKVRVVEQTREQKKRRMNTVFFCDKKLDKSLSDYFILYFFSVKNTLQRIHSSHKNFYY